jgi:hypothetical protein
MKDLTSFWKTKWKILHGNSYKNFDLSGMMNDALLERKLHNKYTWYVYNKQFSRLNEIDHFC